MFNWNIICKQKNVCEMVRIFTEFIIYLFDKYAPQKTSIIRDKNKPWLTSNVRFMMQLRDQAHARYYETKSDACKKNYKDLKHMVNISLYYEKRGFFESHVNSNIKDPKRLWKTLKTVAMPGFNRKFDMPDNFDNPNKINEHFLNVPGQNLCNISDLTSYEFRRHSDSSLTLQPVTDSVISRVILSLSSNAQGVDGISLDMLLATMPFSLTTITEIVNKSITSSIFPESWKLATVRPIPKISNPTQVSELRPISLLPIVSKILEKVVHDQVMRYCEENGILPVRQSGFRKSHSTSTALLDVVDNILEAQDAGSGSILVLLDFSRAFDSINISLLLSKLAFYGFDNPTIKWFDSYLTRRKQRVVLQKSDGTTLTSRDECLDRGIPQGSILGPLLFTIYTADITVGIRNCMYHVYADDLQVYSKIPSTEAHACVLRLNEDLSSIAEWAAKNCLVLNPTKSKYMFMGSKHQINNLVAANHRVAVMGRDIERVTEARNLGVLMDGNLHFEHHIQEVVRNCFYRLKVLYRIRNYLSTELRLRLCEAMILSKLNYCTTVYGPCLYQKTQKTIQRVQNACVRYCFHVPPRSHVTPFLNSANILKMEARQKLHLATLLFGVINLRKPLYLYEKLTWHQSRRAAIRRVPPLPLIVQKFKGSAAFKGSFRYEYAATKCWNNIPPPIRNCKVRFTFKSSYKSYLLNIQKEQQ